MDELASKRTNPDSESEDNYTQGDGAGGAGGQAQRSFSHKSANQGENKPEENQSTISLLSCRCLFCLLIIPLLVALVCWLIDFNHHSDAFASVLWSRVVHSRGRAQNLLQELDEIGAGMTNLDVECESKMESDVEVLRNMSLTMREEMTSRSTLVSSLSESLEDCDSTNGESICLSDRVGKLTEKPLLTNEMTELEVEKQVQEALDMMDLDLRQKIEEMIVNSSVSNAAIQLRVKKAFSKAIMAETTNQMRTRRATEVDYIRQVISASPSPIPKQDSLFDSLLCTIGASGCTQSADVLITPSFKAGSCYPFDGHTGYVVYELREKVKLTKFSLTHVSKSISATPESTPRTFVLKTSENPIQFTTAGEFTYDIEGKPTQYFELEKPVEATYVRFELKSNYGAAHTCLYQLRAHGEPLSNE